MFSLEEVPYLEKEFDRRLITLLQRHSHLSATCQFSLGLNSDNKRFSANDIAQLTESFLKTQQIKISHVDVSAFPFLESSSYSYEYRSVADSIPISARDSTNRWRGRYSI